MLDILLSGWRRAGTRAPLVLIATLCSNYATACETTWGRFGFGGTGMRVHSGEACDIQIGTGPGHNLAAARNVSISISQRPQHGRAGTFGLAGIAYQAPANFVGDDSFKAVVIRELNGKQTPYRISVKVEVYR